METVQKQKLQIRFTRELAPGTKLKTTEIAKRLTNMNEEQEYALNRIFINLSSEYTDQVLETYIYNSTKDIILENASTSEKWTINTTGSVTKFP